MIKKDSTELLELVPAQGLGHDVRNVLVGRDELRPHGKLLNELTDLEVPSLDVLGAGVGDVVLGERNVRCILFKTHLLGWDWYDMPVYRMAITSTQKHQCPSKGTP